MGCQENRLKGEYSSYEISPSYSTDLSQNAVNNVADSLIAFNFNWLSATEDGLETNDRPASSPVFGWVLGNNLEESLLIYTEEGYNLGSINEKGVWGSSPNIQTGRDLPEEIKNIHLRQWVIWITKKASEDKFFMDAFRENIEDTVES